MNIKYINKKKYLAYQVRVPIIKRGIRYVGVCTRFFSKFKYKTMAAALKAATEYRDNYLKKHNALYLLKCENGKRVSYMFSKSNSSGIIGLYKRNGAYYAKWALHKDGQIYQGNAFFSIGRYGKKEAFNLACAARYKNAGQLIVVDKSKLPFLPESPYRIMPC